MFTNPILTIWTRQSTENIRKVRPANAPERIGKYREHVGENSSSASHKTVHGKYEQDQYEHSEEQGQGGYGNGSASQHQNQHQETKSESAPNGQQDMKCKLKQAYGLNNPDKTNEELNTAA